MDLTNKKINLEYEFNKLEDSFYNIDSGLIQHPDLVAFARSLEYFKQLMITNFQTLGYQFYTFFQEPLQMALYLSVPAK